MCYGGVQGGPKRRTQRRADAVTRFIEGLLAGWLAGRHRNTRNPKHGNTEAQEQTEALANTDKVTKNRWADWVRWWADFGQVCWKGWAGDQENREGRTTDTHTNRNRDRQRSTGNTRNYWGKPLGNSHGRDNITLYGTRPLPKLWENSPSLFLLSRLSTNGTNLLASGKMFLHLWRKWFPC